MIDMYTTEPDARAVPRLLVLWGVPGVGKSTLAKWLADTRGYYRIDTDSLGFSTSNTLEWGWQRVLGDALDASAFAQAALAYTRPVVVEYGVYARPGAFDLLRGLEAAGAEPWWLDGDRDAAFDAWKRENRRAGRTFSDSKWLEVVGIIDANWPLVVSFYGSRILRTIEAGPTHVPPDETFGVMLAQPTR